MNIFRPKLGPESVLVNPATKSPQQKPPARREAMLLRVETKQHGIFIGEHLGWSILTVTKNDGKIHHAINGTTHYFDWAIFNSYNC